MASAPPLPGFARAERRNLPCRATVEHDYQYPRVISLTPDPKPSPKFVADHSAAITPQGLADRQALALTALERTRMPMVITDPRQPDNPIVMANRSFLELTGYEAHEVTGRNCRFLQGPGTSQAAVHAIREAIAGEREVEVEILNYRKDGSSFWNQLYLSPIHDDDGRLIYVFSSQLDVTERRKVEGLEAAEKRLLREVDHRSMNVLAIVEGIVRLTRAIDTPQYAAAVQRRVQALARAHTILAERGWVDVPLQKVIQVQLDPFGTQRVRLDGPEVLLAGHLVQPLALVFHELMSNAVTHGCLSASPGQLDVLWTRQDGEQIALDWTERGGPPPAANRPAGFGVTIMKGIVDRQLRGAMEHQWNPAGLTARLSFSVAA